jgi:peptidoglycan hydrolase-like protein with peptidoglycan-binding domain
MKRVVIILLLAGAATAQASSATLSLQVTLDRLGFSPGVIDGRFGPQTRSALLAWQTANEMPATG